MRRIKMVSFVFVCMGAYWSAACPADELAASMQGSAGGLLSAAMGGLSQTFSQLKEGNLDGAVMTGAQAAGQGVLQAQQGAMSLQGGVAGAVAKAQQGVAMGMTGAAGGVAGLSAATAAVQPITAVDFYMAIMGEPPAEDALPELVSFEKSDTTEVVASKVDRMLNDTKLKNLLDSRSLPSPERLATLESSDKTKMNDAGFLIYQEIVAFYEDLLFSFMEHFFIPPEPIVLDTSIEASKEEEDKANARQAEIDTKKEYLADYKKAADPFEKARDKAQLWEELLSYFGDVAFLEREGALEDLKDFIQHDGDGKPRALDGDGKNPLFEPFIKGFPQGKGAVVSAITAEMLQKNDPRSNVGKGKEIFAAIKKKVEDCREEEEHLFGMDPASSFIEVCGDKVGLEDAGETPENKPFLLIKEKLIAARDSEEARFGQLMQELVSHFGVDNAPDEGEDRVGAIKERKAQSRSKLERLKEAIARGEQ